VIAAPRLTVLVIRVRSRASGAATYFFSFHRFEEYNCLVSPFVLCKLSFIKMPLPLDMATWVEDKLGGLTLEEKAMMLSGVDVWRTFAVPRLGIPQLKVRIEPSSTKPRPNVGYRHPMDQLGSVEGPWWMAPLRLWHPVQCLWPLPGTLVSSQNWETCWQRKCMTRRPTSFWRLLVYHSPFLEDERRLIPAGIVCLHRSPLGGRNFESFSGDDPFLGGKLAAAYINAVQQHGIATTVKHFAANDQETRRFVTNQVMSERCLRELHLVPFQIAIRDANPWCLMSSYSKINGIYASNNKRLLTGILRGEWGFDGLVMSDWFGVNSIVPSVEAGLDLEMPGPARKRGKNLSDAVKKGYMKEETLDINVRRVLQLIYKSGKYRYPYWEEPREEAHNRPEHSRFLRKAAADGIVLLKNEKNLLPLAPKLKCAKQIAFIGPNANESVAAGGG